MEDQQIIELYWSRSEAAIDETRKKYASYLRMIAENILHDLPDVEECENDTYLNAWNSIPPTRPENLKAYLARLVRNISINRLNERKSKKRGGDAVTASYEELSECIPDKGSAAAGDAGALRELLDAFLETLPKEKRIIFMKRYWFSYSVSEIAKQTGKKEKYIVNHLYLMRKKLKAYLEEKGEIV